MATIIITIITIGGDLMSEEIIRESMTIIEMTIITMKTEMMAITIGTDTTTMTDQIMVVTLRIRLIVPMEVVTEITIIMEGGDNNHL